MRLEVVRETHALVDEALRHLLTYGRGPDGQQVTPTCRDKCPSCCYEPVYAERSEAALIAHRLLTFDPERRAAVVQRVRDWLEQFRSSELLREESPDVIPYRRMRLACPLLEDGRCSVYAERPIGCRTHLALGPLERCEDTAKRRDQEWVANNDFMTTAIMKMAGGLQVDGKAELLMEHLGLHLAEALTGERVESEARRMLVVEFEDDVVDMAQTEDGGLSAEQQQPDLPVD